MAAFVLDLLDPQSLIYLQTSDFVGTDLEFNPGFHNVQAYSTVPLMPSLYLLSGGLYCIWRRRKRAAVDGVLRVPRATLAYWRAR